MIGGQRSNDYVRRRSPEAHRRRQGIPSEGETLSTVRRRLGNAARTLDIDLEIKRPNDAKFFWLAERRRRGRPRTRRS